MKTKTIRQLAFVLFLLLTAVGQADVFTNVATKDATLRLDASNSNFGVSSPIWVGDYVSPATAYRGVFSFALTNYVPGSVSSAFLLLQNAINGVGNADPTGYVFRLTNTWTESEVTWNSNTATTAWSLPGSSYDKSVTNGAFLMLAAIDANTNYRYRIDITSLVQGWINGSYANDGLVIISAKENSGTFGLRSFESSESVTSGALLPSLEILTFAIPEVSPGWLILAALGTAVFFRSLRFQSRA